MQAADLHAPHDVARTTSLPLRFAIATALGEGCAVFLTTLASEAMSQLGPPASRSDELLLLGGMALAGASEGALLGTAQWLALRPFVGPERARALRFVVLTALAVSAYWTAGIVLSGIEPEGVDSAAVECAIVALAGAGLGGLTALAHSIAISLADRTRYVLASACGWAIGLVVAWLGAQTVPTDEAASVAIVTSALVAVVSGSIAGALGGLALARCLGDGTRGSIVRTERETGAPDGAPFVD